MTTGIYILFLLLVSVTNAFGEEISAKVISIDRVLEEGKKDLLFLSTGHVVKVDPKMKMLKEFIFTSHLGSKWLKFKINEQREVESVEETHNPIPNYIKPSNSSSKSMKVLESEIKYNPSILKSVNEAQALFNEAPYKQKESQCYNKAHIWAYEWRTKHKVYSSKIWIFFTRKYIREYEFEWWFHVAPYVHVVVGDQVKERVMDRKYTKGPIKINDWSNIFMRNSAKCPVVDKYTDQADYPESAHCFLMKSSMYYYQPVDLEKLEQDGTVRTRWIYPEVKHAYQEAFDINI